MRLIVPVATPAAAALAHRSRPQACQWVVARPIVATATALLIFILALLPRVGAVTSYVTADEGNWMERTALFSVALAQGNPSGTYLSGHPGVMTMWAGVLG